MTTLRQMQISRRLHHLAKPLPPRAKVSVEAADLVTLLEGYWFEIDRANALEDRLAGRPVVKRVPYLRLYAGDGEEAADSAATQP